MESIWEMVCDEHVLQKCLIQHQTHRPEVVVLPSRHKDNQKGHHTHIMMQAQGIQILHPAAPALWEKKALSYYFR
jgi:hypothetical protein